MKPQMKRDVKNKALSMTIATWPTGFALPVYNGKLNLFAEILFASKEEDTYVDESQGDGRILINVRAATQHDKIIASFYGREDSLKLTPNGHGSTAHRIWWSDDEEEEAAAK